MLPISARRMLGRPWFTIWLAVPAGAVALTALVELEQLPDEAGLVRDVQAWPFPGRTAGAALRAVTTTWFVIAVGAGIVALHLTQRQIGSAVALGVLLVLLPLTQAGLKELVDRPRPSEVATGIEVRASQASPSFPAGHVMGPTVVYGWALLHLLSSHTHSPGVQPGVLRTIPGLNPSATYGVLQAIRVALIASLSAVLLLTGIVNVHLGVHWPSDVLGGYLWGLVLLLSLQALRAIDRSGFPEH